ncbi:MAG: SAM-dependent methyltransferase [Clostridia bacterium]|nr:SAM-dependent methyltransferase [Clostridia bacterium]
MNTEQAAIFDLICAAVSRGVLRKLVLSQPREDAPAPRQSGKLCLVRGKRVLMLESAFEGGRVSQRLYRDEELKTDLPAVLCAYRQINLLTSAGDAELRTSKKGMCTLLGGGALRARLEGKTQEFVRYDTPIDREKKHLLSGKEPFLHALGISDQNGRVHDKRQAKFRQINRFLEYVESIYTALPSAGTLTIYDLCCGKSYLSFAVYYYLTEMKGRNVRMIGVDLKRDVVEDCNKIATACGFEDMQFLYGDVRTAVPNEQPDMVISLHACDIATDIVLDRAMALGARVILSTPCCHRYLNDKLACTPLDFVAKHPQLRGKLCEALTDGLRLLRLDMNGYDAIAAELTDPENTPKNTLLRAIRRPGFDASSKEGAAKREAYQKTLTYLLGDAAEHYLEEI